jgi:hypothetical protein
MCACAPQPTHILFLLCALSLFCLLVLCVGETEQVRLVVRGTSALRDLVTDLCGHTAPFLGGGGHAHYGMLSAARALVAAEVPRLRAALAANPGYGGASGGGWP